MNTIYEIFKSKAQELNNRCFLKDDNTEITYSDSSVQVDKMAQILYSFGVRSGSVVGIMMSNRAEYVLFMLAINKLGAAFLPINLLCTGEEISEIADWSDMKVLITEQEKAKRTEKVGCRVFVVEELGKIDSITVNDEDDNNKTSSVVAVLLTSGTTGKFKGVILEENTIEHCYKVISSGSEYRDNMVSIVVSPLYHIYPLYNQVFPGIYLGHTLILHNFSNIEGLLKSIEDNRVQMILAAPIIYSMIAMFDMKKKYELKSLELMSYSGAPMPKDVILYLKKNYPEVRLINSYGATETGGTFAVLDSKYALEKIQSVGKKSDDVDIIIRQTDGTCTRECNTKGELLVKTQYMKGYMNVDSSNKFYDGYICTGDYGYFDDEGFIYLEGRIDDMIIVNGVNIHPSYVEKQFSNCPDIQEIIVLSADTILGEQLVAYVKLTEGSQLKDVKKYALDKIDKGLRPMKYVEVNEIPRSAAGKILRKELKAIT